MSSFLVKHYKLLYLLLPALLGIALGNLAATDLGIWLQPPVQPLAGLVEQQPAPARKPTLPEYQGIVARNIFDSTAREAVALTPEEAPAGEAAPAPVARADLALFGTVTRGEDSLAVIRSEKGVKTYPLGGDVPGGGTIAAIERNRVEIQYSDGSTQVLTLIPEEGAGEALSTPAVSAAPAAASRRGSGAAVAGQIKEVGPNRWQIPSQVAEQARGNLNELLKQARMEPNIVDGRTEGFVVRMVQPRSLLAMLGIQRGDVLRQINGVELDSPEKALQIFQQLREARNITIALQRGGNNQTFQYEIN